MPPAARPRHVQCRPLLYCYVCTVLYIMSVALDIIMLPLSVFKIFFLLNQTCYTCVTRHLGSPAVELR